MIVIALLCVVIALFAVFSSIRRPKHFPPGPTWWPILGNSLQVNRLSRKLGGLHFALAELSKTWNTNVLGLKLGSEIIVTVFNYSAVKTVYSGGTCDARPQNFFFKLRCLGTMRGISSVNGEFWHVQKTFVVKNMHKLGFGTKVSEHLFLQELNEMMDELDKGNCVKIGQMTAAALVSVTWTLATGTRLSAKDERLTSLLNLIRRRTKVFNVSGGTLCQYPWLRFIAPEKTGYNLCKQVNKEIKEFFSKTIDQHYRTWKEGMDTDLMYLYISEMKKENAHYSFTEDQLPMLCLDLFIASTQVTSGTLEIAFLMMLLHPKIQEKVQKQLDEFSDLNHNLTYADKYKFPYIEAVLLEVERYRSAVPISGPRMATEDTIIDGHVIPKGATVLLHTYSINMNPDYFEEPTKFLPERFLDEDGQLKVPEEFIPFGLGRRRCIGESLARMTLFTLFTKILQNYSVTPDSDFKMDTGAGLISWADYTAKFNRRRKNI